MGKKRIFSIAIALMLSMCVMLGTSMTTGIVTAYANNDGDDDSVSQNEDGQTNPGDEPVEVDYAFEISTTGADFGTITQGDEADPVEFTVTNIGETKFTLAYEAFDDDAAFIIAPVSNENASPSENTESDDSMLLIFGNNDPISPEPEDDDPMALDPGEKLAFMVSVADYLDPGDYRVTYDFYPLEDLESETHVAVTFSVSVEPAISKVVVSPSNVNVLLGKSYAFEATVYGGNVYDPDVSWEVTGQMSPYTQISRNGVLTIGSDESASSLTVIATSKQDWHYKGEASVKLIEHVIQLSAEPSDGGTVSGGGTVKYGGSVKATASANDYYTFSGWYEGNSLVSTSTQIQISNISYDRSFTAVFKRVRYTVSATVSPSGAGRVENTGTYDGGEEVVLRAIPNDGYDFTGWIMNSQNVSGDLEYVYGPLDKNISLTASFKAKEPRTFRIESGAANEGGRINPSGDNYVQEGKSLTYKMVPNSGYRVHAVAVDGVNIGAVDSYTFSDVYDEHSIAVSFELIPKEAATSSNSDENKKNSQSDGSQDKSKKTAEETEAEKEKAANEAEDQQTKPGLIERIDKENVTEGVSEEKTEEENNVISSRELYDRTYTLEDEAAPLAASAEPLMTTKPSMAQKSNFILRIIVGTLLAIVFASIGYTYFWLFRKGPSDNE